jgi:POLQ-like helicase
MKPERRSRTLLAITQSKAKMFEYGLPVADHIQIPRDPAHLLRLAVGMLGDLAAAIAAEPPTSPPTLDELSTSLRFSAKYFDAFAETELVPGLSPHLVLLASASYYLCNLPGSAKVLASRLPAGDLDLGAGGLDRLIRWLLNDPLDSAPELPASRYKELGDGLVTSAIDFYRSGAAEAALKQQARALRRLARAEGTPRELLFADAACAIALRRIEYSARNLLPQYSAIAAESWATAFAKDSFVRELWPAQRLLGDQGVFAGASAIVQMPTSAGKSRATELTIRSAFISGRASLAIVVAPFRALCHEIRESLAKAFRGEAVEVNELSDAFQNDFDLAELAATFNVLVVTPEKLVYVLRHAPELAERIGLLVFDEGHQFDSGARGVTYELLLTSLKQLVPAETQKVLISAVISNGPEIGRWLNGDGGIVVTGTNLLPTERSIAFASWTTQMGQLQFVEPEDPDREEFFVPRVIRSVPLAKRSKSGKEGVFPTRDDPKSVALYLGLRLVRNGAVAIFCGRKSTAAGLADLVVDAFARNLPMTKPVDLSDEGEVGKISALYEANLSSDASATLAAQLGIFTHHGNTPHGVRLAVEHALKEGLGRFVLCTSTLAQGVNLPIRYLLVTSARQGGETIKVRDFHNLIGRAGRSGMHTEGSVLFADPGIYDRRNVRNSAWPTFKALLQVKNSEPCASSLLSVLDPLKSDGGGAIVEVDPLLIAQAYVADDAGTGTWITAGAQELERLPYYSREALARQLEERREMLAAIESFLFAHWPKAVTPTDAGPAEDLAKQTLAYHLASPEKRAQLTALFGLLATNIASKVTDQERRQVFGRTLYGLGEVASLQTWVTENLAALEESLSADGVFGVVWPCIAARIGLDKFRKWQPVDTLKSFALAWLRGDSFGSIHSDVLAAGARIGLGSKPRKPKIEHIVEIGEGGFGFDGAHAIAGVIEVYSFLRPEAETATVGLLEALHKRFKYGLPSQTAVVLYELGFADRVIASALADALGPLGAKGDVKAALRTRKEDLALVLAQYPAYFVEVFERLTR